MRSSNALVIGTAGHIDHGKTSLVMALTGSNTDRLQEEKRRGISIDLGFAQLRLPEGPVVSFIDVPGHEDFIRNMLAGVAGMEGVLLIVAANESVMPQTREHFEICRLLGLKLGLVVLTKVDVASLEQRNQAEQDIRRLTGGSFLENAPIIPVSAINGSGIPELKRQLSELALHSSRRDKEGIPRLPIDRSFAVRGFGTVITGSLYAGVMNQSETLEILPAKQRVRVRGLQTRNASVTQVSAGQRVAVNLAGVEHHAVKRGHVAVAPGLLTCTRVADIELQWLFPDAPPSPREDLVAHIGTAEVGARLTLHRPAMGQPRFARLRIAADALLLPGDRLVLRRPSPSHTVGGGIVIDAFPPRRVNRARTLARLESLSSLDLGRRIEFLLDETPSGIALAELIRITGEPKPRLEAAMEKNGGIVLSASRAVTRKWIDRRRHQLLKWLAEYHKTHPNASGAPLAMARLGLDAELAALVLQGFSEVRIDGESVALSRHRAQFSVSEMAILQKLEQAFRAAAFQPPSATEVLASAGPDAQKARALLEHLVKTGRLVRIPGDLLFHADVVSHIRTSLAQHKGRRFSVTDFKQWTNISRKFAIPLLEYLDQQRVTRREGDMRLIV